MGALWFLVLRICWERERLVTVIKAEIEEETNKGKKLHCEQPYNLEGNSART